MLKSLSLTEGERGLLLAYICIATFGAGISFTIVNTLGGAEEILRPLIVQDYWMITAGGVGAAAGLFLGRDRLGHEGLTGAGQAVLGAVIITFAAAIIGGTLALPGYGTMFGPFAAIMTFIKIPMLLMFWSVMLLASHLLYGRYRRERDTLFVIPDDGIPV